MSEQNPRKRIPYKVGLPPISDKLEFIKNKCSNNVRKVLEFSEKIQIELCFDKHYYDRLQHGDDNGVREGIDMASVEKLVLKAMKYLLLYSSYNSGFTFTWLKSTYNDLNNPIQIYVHEGLVFSGDNVYLPEIDTSYVYSVSEKQSGGNLFFDGLLSSDPLFNADQGQRMQITVPSLTNALLKLKILKTFY